MGLQGSGWWLGLEALLKALGQVAQMPSQRPQTSIGAHMTVRASDRLTDLIGVGLEFLMDSEGNVRLEFYNGNIVRSKPSGDLENTAS